MKMPWWLDDDGIDMENLRKSENGKLGKLGRD